MSLNSKNSTTRGRYVVVFLLMACGIAFLATVWNYQRNHMFATEATLTSNGTKSQVTANFQPEPRIQIGQRVVVSITGDSAGARGGEITSLTPEGFATIEMDEQVHAPVSSKAIVSIDGTIAPQPAR